MKLINEIIKNHQSGFLCIKGYFYVLGGECPRVFISDEKDFSGNNPIIILPQEISDIVMSKDEILGVLVGGKYLYYSVQIEIEGNINFNEEYAYFETITRLVLFNGDISQEFIMN